jgi:hypothetical protein
LYDGIISSAPGFCIYALVNSPGLQCSIAFTRLLQAPDTEVRSALSGQAYRTRLVGPLSAGGECNIVSGSTLDFFNRYVPALNELIEVRYRGIGRAMGRVSNPASVTSEQHGFDDGTRGKVLHLKRPCGRTSVDCENAALAIVSDGAVPGFVGRYETWSDFLPGGAEDLFPGDALNVNFASRAAVLQAIVDEVAVSFEDLACDHGLYTIHFKSDVADDLAFEFDAQIVAASEANSQFATVLMNLDAIPNSQVGFTTLPALTAATITQVTSTTASLDAGVSPAAAGGFEVRWSDAGWGQGNDQNLAGRFTSQTFTLPRLSKVQDYYIRQYDGSNPPKYSRYSAALHVDYPY